MELLTRGRYQGTPRGGASQVPLEELPPSATVGPCARSKVQDLECAGQGSLTACQLSGVLAVLGGAKFNGLDFCAFPFSWSELEWLTFSETFSVSSEC
eukprot:1160081-Pelagomonas_calceolata.AAC.6